ncbi:MAG: radical SAM family heme chaperone HemW [Bacteroidales bacterium]|nr:radical SAM family heme chaperone HemW [Bacteroidales bacterium]
MAGIYIHVPFCVKKCGYCDFYSIRFCKDSSFVNQYVNSIEKEIVNNAYIFNNQSIDTIYIGGGTPSILPFNIIESFLVLISNHYNISKNFECTIEINPEHATNQYFNNLKSSDFINRLSTGFQAMNDDGLKYLGRNHSVSDNYRYLDLCEKFNFSNFSVDYIFGYEILTLSEIERSFKILSDLNIPHISAYSLGIEENTPFYKKLELGKIHKIDDDKYLEQFKFIHNFLINHGYEHYEISNYSLPNKFSRHNSNYWNFVPYLGFGPSAHSYYNNSRKWNVRNLKQYVTFENFSETEFLNIQDIYNEYIMLRFRTFDGLDVNYVEKNFPQFITSFYNNLNRNDLKQYFVFNKNKVHLTLDGLFISDYIISEFFV